MGQLRISELEAAIAAFVVMIFCIFIFAASLAFAFAGTKIYLTHACSTPTNLHTPNHHHVAIINGTCSFLGYNDIQAPVTGALMDFELLRHTTAFRSIISLMAGWTIVITTALLTLPQWTAAMGLFRAIWFKSGKSPSSSDAVEMTLVATSRHQSVQNLVILIELVTALGISAFIVLVPHSGHTTTLEWIVVNYLTKVLTGRVFCAFFVEIYFHDQLLFAVYTGLQLPVELKQQLENE